jgi:hypothetical protein
MFHLCFCLVSIPGGTWKKKTDMIRHDLAVIQTLKCSKTRTSYDEYAGRWVIFLTSNFKQKMAWHWHWHGTYGTALHFLAAGFFGSPGVDIRLRS